MNKLQPKNSTFQQQSSSDLPVQNKAMNALVILSICALAFFAFGISLKQVGFYLDDWTMFSNLHFAGHTAQELIASCLSDPRVITRPIEAPYFVGLHYAFAANPLGHHIFNLVMEVLSSIFFYLSLSRLTKNMPLSMVASWLFLLYPNHDCTHYWVTASSATFSMTLYMASLWLFIKGLQDQKRLYLFLAAFSYLASVFNYEAFLPLAALQLMTALAIYWQGQSLAKTMAKAIFAWLPYLAVIAGTWIYARLIIPHLIRAWSLLATGDPNHMLAVFANGFNCTILPSAWQFYGQRVHDALFLPLNGLEIVILLLALLATQPLLFAGRGKERTDSAASDLPAEMKKTALLVVASIVTLLASYSIYSIATEYMPRLDTIMNRVNLGGSVGSSLLLAALMWGLSTILAQFSERKTRCRLLLFSLFSSSLLLFFTLADWGLSKPWIASWAVQKRIRQILHDNASRFHDGDAIILAGTPRYDLWAPVYDGVWDFQPMVRLTLDNANVNAGVVSERMSVSHSALKDVSRGYVCGIYPFRTALLLIPIPETWIKIQSAEQFIDTVSRDGMRFGLSHDLINVWQSELKNTHE